jgi:heme A synthase
MDQKYSYIKYGIAAMMILLFMQFIIGIYINLYVSFPPLNSVKNNAALHFPPDYITVMLHMMLGFLLLIVSFIILLLSIKIRNNKLVISSAISFIFVIVAGISGFLFLFNELNIYSITMAISFIIIILSEFYYLYEVKLTST